MHKKTPALSIIRGQVVCTCGGKLKKIKPDTTGPYRCTKCKKEHDAQEVLKIAFSDAPKGKAAKAALKRTIAELSKPKKSVPETGIFHTGVACLVCKRGEIVEVRTVHFPTFDPRLDIIVPGDGLARSGWVESSFHCDDCGNSYAKLPKKGILPKAA